ncbi:hypothetical protein [Amycolatopsis sp. NPDC004079]|uniref:hypothetical protein n=1 Tax=Amycolatopsis sp. NPDC004079 TaxID=3154549 RepID=UPI0033A69AAE
MSERILRTAREPRDRLLRTRRLLLEALADGRTTLSFDTPGWDPRDRAQAMGMFHTAAVTHLWDRHRIIYAAHPQMVEALAKLTAKAIPGEVWQMIPHTEPLVVLPEPVPAELPTGGTGRLAGFFVHGRMADGGLCPVHSPLCSGLGVNFFVELPGRAVLDVVRTTVRTQAAQTLEEMVADGLTRFTTADGPPPEDERWTRYLRTLLTTGVSILLYACTDKRDLDLGPLPAPAGRSLARRGKPGSPRMLALGWHRGPALHAARQRPAGYYRTEGGGWRQPPHQRACSIRTYWTGPGSRVPILKLVAPYEVSQDLLDETDGRPYSVRDVR